ncbi:MAG: ABC transporter permease subunit [Pirellulales bacterium]
MNLVEYLFGPLADVECRRALGKARWIWLRLASALPGLGVVLIFVWIWWVTTVFDSTSSPSTLLRVGVATIGMYSVAVAIIFAPATLAATLAGEKDRGTLALLLTSRVSPREIILAKLASRLLPILLLLLAGVPALVLMAGLPEVGLAPTLLLCLLPFAVALGGAGLALAISTVARKGRDALLAVYLLEIALVLVPLFLIDLVPPSVSRWILSFNPFHGVFLLALRGSITRAAVSIAVWSSVGLLGIAWSAWRLAPIYLRQLNGGSARGKQRERRTMTVSERPMLWKEIHCGQGQHNRLLRWLIWLLMAVLGVTATALAVVIGLENYGVRLGWVSADAAGKAVLPPLVVATADILRRWAELSAYPLSWLVQWAVGMRAAVAIASEREQETWDTLMTTPLEGNEIVGPKIVGSLWSMKLLLLAAAVSWGLSGLSGAMEPVVVWNFVSRTTMASAFMAAVGTWASAQAKSAARAMTVTLALWLAAAIVVIVAGGILTAIGALLVALLKVVAESNHWYATRDLLSLLSFSQGYEFIRLAVFAAATLLAAWVCRRNFDALAGRNYIRAYIPPPLNYVRPYQMATHQAGPMGLDGRPLPPLKPRPAARPVAEMPLSQDLPPIPTSPTAAPALGETPNKQPRDMPAIPLVMPIPSPPPDERQRPDSG